MTKQQLLAQKTARYLERRLSKHDVTTPVGPDSAQGQLRENEYSQLENDWESALALSAIPGKPGMTAQDLTRLGELALRYGIS